MPRLFLLGLLLAVALDFSTPEVVLSVAGGRSVQWDDEEEGVPARRERESGEEWRVAAFPVAPRLAEPARPSIQRRAYAHRLDRPPAWRLPFRQALAPSVRSASPPDDH